MQNYKDLNGKLHVIDSELFEKLLPTGCVKITQSEADVIANPPPTLEKVIAEFEDGIQAHLDVSAQEAGYDNILTACSYVGAPNPFEAESKTFVTWRGNVWAYCYAELQKVISGERPMPTLADIISELPAR